VDRRVVGGGCRLPIEAADAPRRFALFARAKPPFSVSTRGGNGLVTIRVVF
jgi:hypothetical protein